MIIALAMIIAPSHAEDSIAAIIGQRAPTAILRIMPDDTPPNQRMPGLSFIAGYEVIGQPIPLSAEQAARLAAAIKDPAAFDGAQNEEHMRPGVAYRFGTGADAVDMLVCFSCDKIAVVPPGAAAITSTHHIAQATRDTLLGIAKELLPKDEAIQELPRVRSVHPIPPPAVPVPKDAPR
jgi:hypothetical protein